MGTAVEGLLAFLERLALLVADEHHPTVVELGQARDDRAVVAEGTVAMQLDELVEDQLDVVAGVRPIGMAGHLDDVPRVELVEHIALEPRDLDARRSNGVLGFEIRIGIGFELRELLFEFKNRSLEAQSKGRWHFRKIRSQGVRTRSDPVRL